MKFNQKKFDLTCQCLLIVVPLLLLLLTNLGIWEIVILLIILTIILKLFKAKKYFYEKFIDQCPNCENPYSTQKIMQSFDLNKNPVPIKIQPIMTIPIEQSTDTTSSLLPSKPQSLLINDNQPISINKITEKISICEALKKSGFDPSWTLNDISEMLKTPDGQQQIKKINQSVINLSKIEKLTNQDIVNCYPQYITDYICQKNENSNQQCDNLNMQNLKKQIVDQKRQLDQQKQKIDQLNRLTKTNSDQSIEMTRNDSTRSNNRIGSKPTESNLNIIDLNQSNNLNEIDGNQLIERGRLEESSNNLNNKLNSEFQNEIINLITKPELNKNCDIEKISIDIRLEIEKFYVESFEKIKKNNPALSEKQINQIKSQYLKLSDIVYGKSILEFKQLIVLYENKTLQQWKNDLITRKTASIRGHQVPGTDFYISWPIFDKNIQCFGFKK